MCERTADPAELALSVKELGAAYLGGPALSTHVLATLGIRNAFELGDPKLGMATVLTALPLLIPLVILLMRQLQRSEVTI